MNTKTYHSFMLALIAVILGAGWVVLSVGDVYAENDTVTVKKSVAEKEAAANKPIVIRPSKGTKAQRMLMAQAAGDTPAGSLSKIVDLQTALQDSEVSIKLRSNQGLEYTAFKLVDPLRLVLDFANMEQGELSGVMEVNQGVVNIIRPLYFEEAKVLRLEIGLNEAANYEIQRPSSYVMDIRLKGASTPAVEAKTEKAEEPALPEQTAQAQQAEAQATPAPAPDSKEPGKEKASGLADSCEPILGGVGDSFSMDFQNANIKNIFRIFAEVSGFNLVLSPDVGGSVNVRLIDVPWNQAFELILENNAMGRLCEGTIIRVVPKATLLAAQVAEPLITEMIRINYADIKDMLKNLEGLKSERGSISADVRTNTLIMTDIPEKVNEMIAVVKTLDVKTPQVMIESKIVEVTRGFSQQLGIQWGGYTERVDFGMTDGFPAIITSGATNADRNQYNTPGKTFQPVVDLGITDIPAGQFGVLLSTFNTDHVLDIQLEALEEQGKSRTIANPKVTTLDNKEAKIQSGTRFPVQTFSANEGVTIRFVDANLELKVTPHITADENVYMKIAATQNNIIEVTSFGIPIIATKEAFTDVLVLNGATTVLGGLYQKSIREDRRSVPFFDDIPFIGYLFKSRSQTDDISELLIFVTPTIVRSETSFAKK